MEEGTGQRSLVQKSFSVNDPKTQNQECKQVSQSKYVVCTKETKNSYNYSSTEGNSIQLHSDQMRFSNSFLCIILRLPYQKPGCLPNLSACFLSDLIHLRTCKSRKRKWLGQRLKMMHNSVMSLL